MLSKETERTLQATLRLLPKISGNLQIGPFTHQDVPTGGSGDRRRFAFALRS